MSSGNSYNGGRTRVGTKLYLNLYDLSPLNDCLFQIGVGLHHSGIEIMGREYSFGSGSGIFESSPKEAGGARFKFQLEMGTFEGGSKELNRALDNLRSEGFGSNDYHLIYRNCNHFSNALVWKLLRIQIPNYVNRIANFGQVCLCLLPKSLIEDSPVGGSNQRESSFLVPTHASMNRGAKVEAFTGKGYSLSDNNSGFSRFAQTDVTDRRERARKAALARLEKKNKQQED